MSELKLYDWRTDEPLMLGVWAAACQDGSMEDSFAPEMRYLSSFLAYYRERVSSGISVDDKGIWFLFSGKPIGQGVEVGLWVREDRRHSKDCLKMVQQAHQELFAVAKSAIAYVTNPEKVKAFEHYGYTPVGILHGLVNDQDVYILEKLNERYGRRQRPDTDSE